jgi:hypothetical protein
MSTPFTSWFHRIAVVVAAAASVVAVSATPAMAHENITISGSPGRMTFYDDGDVFEVCDTSVDSVGVVGKLYYKPLFGDWYVSETFTDGGDAGCDKSGHDVNNVGDYQMKLYWNMIEVAKSRVFNE